MSLLASTDIELKEIPSCPLDLLDIFAKAGWNLNDGETICYLPLGDKDDFSWKFVPLTSVAIVKRELAKKIVTSELIGICITWKDSQVGGQLLYNVQIKKLSFVWNINRRRKSGSDRETDFSWYEEKIIKTLNEGGLQLLSVNSKDID